ncbi:ABC-type sugar transport system, periplasmic component [Paenibacillus pasadenensis]|uniref:ABC-type sugar transport system, periplasmic component n=1 Tax=Paenibacillus pasadenensis TaxID=217090 RepID=A0A2N5N803_9BACL|nr:extracellular solute-binding protein [Paenibacillus pasadenensis]PLT46476.1 ABC-type sugar transport system, periplasmic component [Paenibacillus pasadenensis]
MKRKRMRTSVVLLTLTALLAGCSSGAGTGTQAPAANAGANAGANAEAPPADNAAANAGGEAGSGNEGGGGAAAEEPIWTETDMTGTVTFWTFSTFYGDIVKEFNKVFPNIKVNVSAIDFGAMHDKLQTTLAAGKGAPDVAQVEQGQFVRYLKGDVLEDLLQQPYDAGKYKDDTTEYNWVRWMNQDNTKLLGMPWDVTPSVLYYRADIFEELGLPSDPTELGEYIQDPENWLAVEETLAANGKFGTEWRDGPIHWAGDALGYFDKDYNWLRNNDELVKILDVTKRQNQLKATPHISGLFDDKGKALTKSGKLASMVLGSWGARDIAKTFPDQKGKWRASRLPMGISFGGGGSAFIIPKQVPDANKKAAWKFVEFMQRSEDAWKLFMKQSVQPGWKSIAAKDWYAGVTNDYFGGQADYALYTEVAESLQPKKLTTLDGKAWDIWLKGVLEALDKNVDSKTELNKIESEIKRKLGPDIEKLKNEQAAASGS